MKFGIKISSIIIINNHTHCYGIHVTRWAIVYYNSTCDRIIIDKEIVNNNNRRLLYCNDGAELVSSGYGKVT